MNWSDKIFLTFRDNVFNCNWLDDYPTRQSDHGEPLNYIVILKARHNNGGRVVLFIKMTKIFHILLAKKKMRKIFHFCCVIVSIDLIGRARLPNMSNGMSQILVVPSVDVQIILNGRIKVKEISVCQFID